MMLNKRQIDALKKQAKRRAGRPHHQQESLKASAGVENRMIQFHADVLRAAERALAIEFRNSSAIDDRHCKMALQASIRSVRPSDERAAQIVDLLSAHRANFRQVPDDLWHDVLRVVLKSVRRHSQCRPGDVSYLAFIAEFVA